MDLRPIQTFILDILFPVSCLGCGKNNQWICESCFSKIILQEDQVCPYCEKAITPDGRVCFGCKNKQSLDGLLVAASYSQKLVSLAVHNYKYKFVSDLSVPLGKLLLKRILKSELPLSDLLIPVPLHSYRLRWRGFNQSRLLAEYLGENLVPELKIPVLNSVLLRRRYTLPQMKIADYFERQKNIQGIFCLGEEKEKLIGKRIWLIDDIATTGSTLFECTKVLKQAGAKEVFAIVIARQEINKNY